MNAADVRKLTEQAKSEYQAREEAAWWATGIAEVERYIQTAAANQLSTYRHVCSTCPDFVVQHFEDRGFNVTVQNTRSLYGNTYGNVYGNVELQIDW